MALDQYLAKQIWKKNVFGKQSNKISLIDHKGIFQHGSGVHRTSRKLPCLSKSVQVRKTRLGVTIRIR